MKGEVSQVMLVIKCRRGREGLTSFSTAVHCRKQISERVCSRLVYVCVCVCVLG